MQREREKKASFLIQGNLDHFMHVRLHTLVGSWGNARAPPFQEYIDIQSRTSRQAGLKNV